MTNLQKIQGSGNDGTFVLDNQTLATKEGFRNVSKTWYDKTISYEKGRELMAQDRAESEDIKCNLNDMVPTIADDGRLCLWHRPTERQFFATDHALQQMCSKASIPHTYPLQLSERKDKVRANDILQYIFTNEWNRLKETINARKGKLQERNQFIFRVRKDGTLRAMLSEIYAIVNNEWYMDIIQELIPDGRLSHWRGDSDTIFGNVFIPDTIREEDDSDYGGMLSVSNCEIGTRQYNCLPSVFRAICMNGCIWNQKCGESLRKVHKGKLDLIELKQRTIEIVHQQIPLMHDGMDRLLNTRTMKTDVNMKAIFAQVAKDNRLVPKVATKLLNAYATEMQLNDSGRGTLFGIINSVTRAGQTLDNKQWYKFDTIGGDYANFSTDDWTRLTNRASNLKADVVDDSFVLTV